MKKLFLITIILGLFIPNLIYAEDTDLAPNASSAIIIEASTGEIIWQKNAHEKLAPASMTKIMSMLLIVEALENGKISWDDKVTASVNASSMGGSQIFLQAGEVMSVRELVKAIAIASGNDATVAMAEKIAGTEANFVKMMNERSNKLGMKNTNFKNSTGLDAENHYTTAYDMAMISKELIKHEEILEYTGTYEDYLRQGTDNSFWLVNTNKLVRFYEGVDGLKTGYTSLAGYCLTSTAKKNGMRLITVVMKEPDSATRNSETSSMLNYGFNMYSIDQIIDTKTSLGEIEVELGKKQYVDIIAKEEVNILNNNSEDKRKVTYEIELNKIKAPIKNGDVIGKISVIEKDKSIMSIDLTVRESVDKANIFTIFFRNFKNIINGRINI